MHPDQQPINPQRDEPFRPLTLKVLHSFLSGMLKRGADPDKPVLLAIPDLEDDSDDEWMTYHEALACSVGGTDEDDERAEVCIRALSGYTF